MATLNDLYASSDILLLPSISEGSANVIYEALSWGCLVICSDQSGAPFSNNNGGYITPAGDVDAICNLLEGLHKDRETLYKQALTGQNIAQTQLSFSAYCDALGSTLKQLESS